MIKKNNLHNIFLMIPQVTRLAREINESLNSSEVYSKSIIKALHRHVKESGLDEGYYTQWSITGV